MLPCLFATLNRKTIFCLCSVENVARPFFRIFGFMQIQPKFNDKIINIVNKPHTPSSNQPSASSNLILVFTYIVDVLCDRIFESWLPSAAPAASITMFCFSSTEKKVESNKSIGGEEDPSTTADPATFSLTQCHLIALLNNNARGWCWSYAPLSLSFNKRQLKEEKHDDLKPLKTSPNRGRTRTHHRTSAKNSTNEKIVNIW